VIYLEQGAMPTWTIYPAVEIMFFALLVGSGGCIFLGIPVLLFLNRLRLNRPWIAATTGFVLAISIFALLGAVHDWPLYAFLGTLGAASGFIASYLSVIERQPQLF